MTPFQNWLQSAGQFSSAADPSSWPPRNESFAYDWSQPTTEFYRDETADLRFAQTFASARKQLDYNYHTNLVLARQGLQDGILDRVVSGASPPDRPTAENRPWIIFSAGPMAVGKGYTLTKLQQSKLLDLSAYVKIDPDMLKSELPEIAGYLRIDKESAATKLHRESTQMADVLLEYALEHERPILVDGSLRDVDYYRAFFQRLREQTNYRIAILHVTADRAMILNRARARAVRTNRVVPMKLLQRSMDQVPQSVAELGPLADAVHVISNNEGRPLELVSSKIMVGEQSMRLAKPSWEDFRHSWYASPRDSVSNAPPAVADVPVVDIGGAHH